MPALSFRSVLRAVALLVCVTLLSHSPASAQAEKPRVGGAMIVGLAGEPGILNAAISANLLEKTVSSNVFSMLIRLNFKFEPVPDLAETWSVSDDGLSYTFNLRKGVKWHDGQPFSSADVKFTIENVIIPLHGRGSTYGSIISKVDAPDDNTVIIRLKTPFGPLMNALGYDFFILPKHLYEGTDIRSNPYNSKPIGTGPFKFAEWKKGSHITLERNKDFYDANKPHLDRLIFQVIPDASSRVLALESGDIDYLSYESVPSSAAGRLLKNPKLTSTKKGFESLASIAMLTFNQDNAILKDVRVRRALAYATNKQLIAERADYSIGKPATGPIASSSWAYEPNVELYKFDPAVAAKMLDEAGYPVKADGTRFSLRLTADGGVEFNRKTAEILKEQYGQIGVKVEIQLVERNVMLDRVYSKREYDTFLHTFSTGADPAIDVSRLYVSTNIRPVNFTNGAGYRSEAIDKLMLEGQNTSSTEKRTQAYREAQRVLAQDEPMIWLVEIGILGVWNKKIHGLHEWSAYSYYSFWDAWSEDGKPSK
ncbi:ABC transporter substrate-binding protein [Bosea sp. BK604]|uniref:ABC transporter substrate-binding protein n=1 Tax=Bosea sp. BK604 TaxID=2512180 RepID=UPI001042FA04|nr:ABC transporter substrate-binding protein [Bosea sp. BK604]TCR62997.1 peptide/nickel transport system substrate-binding protein [Bosea sp. BK604]